jgi:formylglycine-generating enzyme required for sulfatase activity
MPLSSSKNNIKLSLDIGDDCAQLELLHLKAGTFEMGHSPDSNLYLSDKSFKVTLSKDFWLGKYLVTQAQWQAVIGKNPSKFKGKNLPVENISWEEAKSFCEKLRLSQISRGGH